MQNYVSFDFDGVLHVSMNANSIHTTIWSWIDGESERPRPRLEYHQMLKREAHKYPIIITTSRCEENRDDIQDFLDFYRLPVKEIYLTCMEPKIQFLMNLSRSHLNNNKLCERKKIIRHYDDDSSIKKQIQAYNSNQKRTAKQMAVYSPDLADYQECDIQFIQVPMVTAKMAKGENPYGECFKEFLSHEQPNKAKGYINKKGSIHYHENPMGWIQFKRINLEGSQKNSFWNVCIPTFNSQVKEALRIWALNMPEHYNDDVIIQNKGKTTVERLANFDFKLEPIESTSVTVIQLSLMPMF